MKTSVISRLFPPMTSDTDSPSRPGKTMHRTHLALFCGLLVLLAPGGAGAAPGTAPPEQEEIPLLPDLYWQCRDVLRKGLDSEEFWPSMHAAEALTEEGLTLLVRYRLSRRLPGEKDPNRMCGIARELVRAGDTGKADVLVRVLTSPESTMDHRIHAAESLYKVNAGRAAGAALQSCLDRGNPVLELMAAAALVRAGKNDAMDRIRSRLKSSEPKVFRIAAWLAGRFGDRSAVPALRRLVPIKCDPLSHSFVINALARLGDPEARKQVSANLKHSDASVRTYAAATLGAYGTPRDIMILRPLLEDPNFDTRIRAAQAILRIMRRQMRPDTDRDGIPDAVERELGAPPDEAETFVHLWHDAPRLPAPDVDPETVAPHPVEIRFCHVGFDRFLWAVRFDRPYSNVRTVFHMYTDLDDDRSNGRQDSPWARGVDIMYTFVNGRFAPRIFTPSLRVDPGRPIRGMIIGDALWLADDVRVHRENGKTRFRMWTLSEYRNREGRVTSRFSTPAQVVQAPLRPERQVPELPVPKPQGVETFPPSWEMRHGLQFAPGSVELDGASAVRQDGDLQGNGAIDLPGYGAGSVRFTVPITGRRYIAAYLYALRALPAALSVSLDGERIAVMTAGTAEDPGILAVTRSPASFQKGSVLEFRPLPRSGRARLRQVLLLDRKPRFPPLRIEHVHSAVLPPSAPGLPPRVIAAWTTNRPAVCELRTIPVPGKKEVRISIDRSPAEIHRFIVPEAWRSAAERLDVRISARDALGKEAQAGPVAVPLRRPHPRKSQNRKPVRVSLTVQETSGRPRHLWPVRSGVPFPEGALADSADCRILGPDGSPVPAQFQDLAWWPDGSVKWLLVDFLADTVAKKGASGVRYTLVTGPPDVRTTPALPRVRVEETPESIVIATGALRRTLPRNRFDPFGDAVRPSGSSSRRPGGLVVVDGDGTVLRSYFSRPEEVRVEAAGPVRATLLVRGHLIGPAPERRKGPAYMYRLDFFAGSRMVRCTLSLDNDITSRKMSLFREAFVRIPLPVKDAVFAGDGSAVRSIRTAELPARLLQDYDNRWQLRKGAKGEVAASGRRTSGVVRAGGVTVAVRDFWQRYPKALQVDRSGISVEILPRLPEDQYSSKEDRNLLDRLYFWCDKGRYKLRTGVRVTTVFAIDFGSETDPVALAGWVQNPLFAACSPEWYCASGVMGPLVPRRPGLFPKYEENFDHAFAGFLARREKVREYGFMNFGDWYGERRWNWGNIEYDTQGALGLAFLRTARLDVLRRAVEAEAHNADIDTIHYDRNPGNVGRVHVHCLGHTGGYFPAGFKGMSSSFTEGAMTPSHTWARGHFLLWALTGEPRFRETGDLVAGHLAAVDAQKSYIGRSRSGGWTLIALTSAYQVTGDPYYLAAAHVMTRKILSKQRPDGQWRHPIWEARDETPQPWGCKPFMTGIILHGLCMMDRIAPDPAIKQAIRRGARYLWDHTYLKKDHGFIYAEAAKFRNSGGIWTLPLVGDGLAYACRLDPAHRDEPLLLDACSWNFYKAGISSFGKSFTQGICFMPYMLPQLMELGVTRIPPPVEPDRIRLRKALVLPVGGRAGMRIWVQRVQRQPVEYRAEFAGDGVQWLAPPAVRTLRWTAAHGLSAGPVVTVRAPDRPGRATLRVVLTAGSRREEREILLATIRPAPRPNRAAWVTSDDDWLRRAAEACGAKIEAVEDLRRADLAPYGTLIMGAEAWEKDYAHCRSAFMKVLEFVARGGRLICGQLNDAHWRLEFLPYDLMLSDANSTTGDVVAPRHPLFRGLRPADLRGVVCYDTVAGVGPEWRPLLLDASGNPAVLEATVGGGSVLVIMPSFDRAVVAPANAPNPRAREACRRFIKNLIGGFAGGK